MEPHIDELFKSHKLNALGQDKVFRSRVMYTNLLDAISEMNLDGREMAIVKTKLQEASMFTIRAISVQPGNQE